MARHVYLEGQMSIRPNPHNSIRVGPSKARPTGLYFVLALSVLANVYFVLTWQPTPEANEATAGAGRSLTETTIAAAEHAGQNEAESADAAVAVAPADEATTEPAAEEGKVATARPTAADAKRSATAVDAAAPAPEAAATAAGAAPESGTAASPIAAASLASTPKGARSVHVLVQGPISHGFEKAVGASGVRLAMVASRLLVWNLNLNRDPRKGDTIDLIYSVEEGGERITIHAMRYASKKFSRNFDAYRYQPVGRDFSSYFDETGREVPARLTDSPISAYQEITSLIGDGRGHHGMDFKAPVGTQVSAPWDGQILRTNWNWKYNGNSVELRSHDGRRSARFLHLDKLAAGIVAGARVKRGQALASSGNTGRSFAPHLHYEISDGSGRVLDPLEVHDTRHPRLSGADLDGFKAAMATLNSRLGS